MQLVRWLYFPKQEFRRFIYALVEWLLRLRYPTTTVLLGVASMGLGIGILLALFGTVLSQPSATFAIPGSMRAGQSGPLVRQVVFNGAQYSVGTAESVDAFYGFPRSSVVQWLAGGRPGEASASVLLVGATHPLARELSAVDLGEKMQLIGQNNGRYRYEVLAKQVASLRDIPVLNLDEASLYVVVPESMTSQDFVVLVFR